MKISIFFGLAVLFTSLSGPVVKAQDIPVLRSNSNVFVKVKSLTVSGNKRTKDYVILAESKINVGDSISLRSLARALKTSKENILNTNLFNEVDINIESWKGNEIELNIGVKERWYVYPKPIFELTGITFQEWLDVYDADLDRVSYGAKIQHYNHRKRAERMNFTGKTGFEKQLGLGYTFTGLDKARRWGLGLNYAYISNKGVAYDITNNIGRSTLFDINALERNIASVAVRYRKDIRKQHSFGASYHNYRIADTISRLNPEYFLGNKRQAFGAVFYNLHIENRNLVQYPTTGNSFSAGITYRGIGNEDLDLYSLGAEYNRYEKITPKLYAAGLASVRITKGNKLPFYNRHARPLADNLIRGYEQYRLFPEDAYVLKAELKYQAVHHTIKKIPVLPKAFEPVVLRIYPKVFFDTGKTSSNTFATQNPLNNDFLYSFGTGVDVVSIYDIPVRAEISRNHLGENNLSFSLGKVF